MTSAQPATQYRICRELVIDSSDTDAIFDAAGVSNHYHDFHANIAPHWQTGPEGSEHIERTVEAMKKSGKGRDFDSIIGLSGGADSSYMLHKMVTEYGLRPLVFHVDAGWNSEIAVHNINCMIDKLGLDLFTEVINWEEMRDFQLAMFKSGLPNIDIPQDIAFIGVLYQYAEKHGIEYILNGGNISTEAIGYPLQYFYYADMTLTRAVLARHGTNPMRTYPFTTAFYRKVYLPFVKRIKMFKPLNFMPYVKHEAMQELNQAYGWKPYPQKHFESRFTRFFEGYWLPTRFGYDVRRSQFSSMILTGQMTRDEALAKLEQSPYDEALIAQDFDYIATKLGIRSDELREYHQMPLKFYWDYPNRKAMFEFGESILRRVSNIRRGGAY
jgi:N-acetyl sugar amidotransferase